MVLLSFGSHSVKGIDPPLALNFSKEEPPEDFDSSTQSVGYKCVYYKKGKTVPVMLSINP